MKSDVPAPFQMPIRAKCLMFHVERLVGEHGLEPWTR
jgi:hypothetical protein